MRKPSMFSDIAALIVGIVLIYVTNHVGWWWATAVVGAAIGAVLHSGWRMPVTAVLTGGLGWVLPLVWQSFSTPIGQAASTVSGVMGFGTGGGWIVWTLTGVFGAALCVCPAWFVSAATSGRTRRDTSRA